MAHRFQHALRNAVPSVEVIGWGAHRYHRGGEASPAKVALMTYFNAGDGVGVTLSVDLDFTLEHARALAKAILEAADRAEAAPLGYQQDDPDSEVR